MEAQVDWENWNKEYTAKKEGRKKKKIFPHVLEVREKSF